MRPGALKRLLDSMPGATEEFPFSIGTSVYKVGGKLFALTRFDDEPLRVSLKCDPELLPQLQAAHAAIGPAKYLSKRHWNTVTLDGSLPDEMVRELVEDSYDLVVAGLPRAKRAALDWPGDDPANSASSS